jgi:low affinity Fe/Cu permease
MNGENQSWFARFAKQASCYTGKPATFGIAVLLIIVWGTSGPLFGFSDSWQLVVNTTTTIVTFLMVFLIQNSQNRDTEALQIKLDELLRVQKRANNSLMDLEDLSQEELDDIREKFVQMAEKDRQGDGEPAAANPEP